MTFNDLYGPASPRGLVSRSHQSLAINQRTNDHPIIPTGNAHVDSRFRDTETAARQVRQRMLGRDNFLHASIVERQFIQRLSDSNANGNGGIPSQNVGVLDGPTLRTRGELTPSEEALRFGWASWAIHGLFKKLTDCGDAS
jgi:hypothetical protein